MKISGIIGWPVGHSLSPKLHSFWLNELGLEGLYAPFAVQPQDLSSAIQGIRALGLQGCNVTLPHKEKVMPLLDRISDEAQHIGAVNTIIREGEELIGYNSDAYGFYAHLEASVPNIPKDSHVLILGAGGAAKGIIYALLNHGFNEISITNRTTDRALELNKFFGDRLNIIEWDQRDRNLQDIDMVVNSTSLGMDKMDPLVMDLAGLKAHAIIYDIVYRPLKTGLLSKAEARGLRTVDGLGMLIYQAMFGFEKWFGQKPTETESVRAYLEKLLSGK